MGSSESKQSSTETEKLNSSHQTTDTDEDRTPIANRRVIQLTDPRSPPPDDVSRTPIVHAEKPAAEPAEPTSPVLKINTRITQEVTDMHDPRSPSCNVARTPQPFKFGDPRSPSQAVSRTPHIAHIEEQGGMYVHTVWLTMHIYDLCAHLLQSVDENNYFLTRALLCITRGKQPHHHSTQYVALVLDFSGGLFCEKPRALIYFLLHCPQHCPYMFTCPVWWGLNVHYKWYMLVSQHMICYSIKQLSKFSNI